MSNDIVCFDKTSIFTCKHGVDISGLHVLTFFTANYCTGNNNIDFIDDWPSKSPDLNPIEYLWDNLDTRVRQRQNPPGNVNELRDALLEEWNNIPQAQINNLIHSMRRRCQAVSNARGGHTRY